MNKETNLKSNSHRLTDPIKITLIGSGGVATNIGRLFKASPVNKGLIINQVLGRSETSTKVLADILGCPYSLDPAHLNQEADLYIISIQDQEIPGILPKIKIPSGAMIVHTAGGVSIEVFKGLFARYGVLYPLQSLRKETTVIPKIPFYLDTNDDQSKAILEEFAKLTRLDYRWADDNERLQLHIAAVFCSNFPNYFYTMAEHFCRDNGLDFSGLLPVIDETAGRLKREGISPSSLQTGPAIRKDLATTKKHLDLLQGDAAFELKEVYQYLTTKIMDSKLFNK